MNRVSLGRASLLSGLLFVLWALLRMREAVDSRALVLVAVRTHRSVEDTHRDRFI